MTSYKKYWMKLNHPKTARQKIQQTVIHKKEMLQQDKNVYSQKTGFGVGGVRLFLQ